MFWIFLYYVDQIYNLLSENYYEKTVYQWLNWMILILIGINSHDVVFLQNTCILFVGLFPHALT